MVKMLTVLVSSISNSQLFLLKKNVSRKENNTIIHVNIRSGKCEYITVHANIYLRGTDTLSRETTLSKVFCPLLKRILL